MNPSEKIVATLRDKEIWETEAQIEILDTFTVVSSYWSADGKVVLTPPRVLIDETIANLKVKLTLLREESV